MVNAQQLMSAVRKGRFEELVYLLDQIQEGRSLPPWTKSYSLLKESIEKRHVNIAKLLLQRGCKVIGETSAVRKSTPLHIAVERCDDIELIDMLVKAGVDKFALNEFGKRPFQIAIEKSKLRVLEYFLNIGVQVNYGSKYHYTKGKTPLHEAVEHRRVDVVRLFLERGADVNAICEYKGKIGFTPLHFAAENSNLEIVEMLLEKCTDVDCRKNSGETPLYLAVAKGCIAIVRALLNKGASIDILCESPNLLFASTPLHAAAERGDIEVLKLLLQQKPNLNVLNGRGVTPLFVSVMSDKVAAFQLLIENGAEVKYEALDQKSMLHQTALRGNLSLCELLLKHNHPVNVEDHRGNTPLHTACENSRRKVALALLKAGAHVNATNCAKDTPLHTVCENEDTLLASLLLKFGANPNVQNEMGFTPLHWSAEHAQDLMTVELLLAGADANIEDEEGNSPFSLSEFHKPSSTYAILSRHIVASHLLGKPVSPGNSKVLSDKNLESFKKDCEKEIKILKKKKVAKNSYVHYIALLERNVEEISMLLRNKDILQALSNVNFLTRFDIFGSQIKRNFDKALERATLYDKSVEIFNGLFPSPQLPQICVERIIHYLTNDDLKILNGQEPDYDKISIADSEDLDLDALDYSESDSSFDYDYGYPFDYDSDIGDLEDILPIGMLLNFIL